MFVHREIKSQRQPHNDTQAPVRACWRRLMMTVAEQRAGNREAKYVKPIHRSKQHLIHQRQQWCLMAQVKRILRKEGIGGGRDLLYSASK
jgi:hypothetical protein